MKRLLVFLTLVAILVTGCYNAGYDEGNAVKTNDLTEDLDQDIVLDTSDKAEAKTEEKEATEPAEKATGEVESMDKADSTASEVEVVEEKTTVRASSNEGKVEEPQVRFRNRGRARYNKTTLSRILNDGVFDDRTTVITVVEGDPIKYRLEGSDPDGDKITYSFNKPLDVNGQWQTKVGDEGTYKTEIVASDGEKVVTRHVAIRVLHRNRPPSIEALGTVVVDEGAMLRLEPRITDPEQDELTVTYSGWSTTQDKKLGYDDAGRHSVTITASDGEAEVSSTVVIVVNNVNRAPAFEVIVE